LLERAEVNGGNALWPVWVVGRPDLANEVLVAGEDHDQNQIRGEHDVDLLSTPTMSSCQVSVARRIVSS
jgi:hypothetical protein